ncbi:MAG: hypothetical protein EAX96_21190 [Candidatus Lokiarchaeota archaeon]|nr:hypothetical protein [Candidatus Lokiarchaeota archaeon]
MNNEKNVNRKLRFTIHGSVWCGDEDISNFLDDFNISSRQLWNKLKEKALDIKYHIGESFSGLVPEGREWKIIPKYSPECENIPKEYSNIGKSWVSEFCLLKKDIMELYKDELASLILMRGKKRIKLLFNGSIYLIDEKNLVFKSFNPEETMKALFRINKSILFDENGTFKLKEILIGEDISFIPEKQLNKNLKNILEAIRGSSSTGLSPLDVLLKYIDDELEEIETPDRLQRHLNSLFYENLQHESYNSDKYDETLTLVTYRCAIDDYDVLLFVNGEEYIKTRKYRYDDMLGFVPDD